MTTRALVFRSDNIVIQDGDRRTEYRITGSGGGRLMLEPVLPTEPGLYMTANNIPTLGGVLIQLEEGVWRVLTGGYERREHSEQLDQIKRWNDTLGLSRVYLTATPPKKEEAE